MPTVNGNTYSATCATLQAQLDAAAAANVNLTHQVILSASSGPCQGPYVMRAHNGGTGWILIKGENFAALPASGTRVTAATDAAAMPQVRYGEDGAVRHVGAFSAATGAQRYRIIGIDMVENSAFPINWSFVTMGYATSESTNTGYFILDRVLIRNRTAGSPIKSPRGVWGEAELGNTAMVDSEVTGIAYDMGDSQGWVSINNPGPIHIQNNLIQATGENLMLCGATPLAPSLHPGQATIKWNEFSKIPAWYGASGFVVKTLLELKCGKKVLIEANLFRNMPGNDVGFAMRLTPRNDSYASGAGTFLEVSDVRIRFNTFANIAAWINTIASDDGSPCGAAGPACNTNRTKRMKIDNNLVYGLGNNCIAGSDCGAMTQILTGGGGNDGTNLTPGVRGACTDAAGTCKHEDLQIEHNTIDLSGCNGPYAQGMLPITSDGMFSFHYNNNLVNACSVAGIYDRGELGDGRGTTRLNHAVSGPGRAHPIGWVFKGNRFAHAGSIVDGFTWGPPSMPAQNDYVTDASSFLWVNPCTTSGDCSGTYDYSLKAGSPAKNAASDGTDQGVQWNLFNAAENGRTSTPQDTTPPAAPSGLSVDS